MCLCVDRVMVFVGEEGDARPTRPHTKPYTHIPLVNNNTKAQVRRGEVGRTHTHTQHPTTTTPPTTTLVYLHIHTHMRTFTCRRKYDAVKWGVRRMEDLLYELSVVGVFPPARLVEEGTERCVLLVCVM